MSLPDVKLLQQADIVLSKCGRPMMPSGVRYVPLPKYFFFQAAHTQNTTETEAREIYGDTIWMLRAISGIPPNNQIYFRIQLPNGRFLENQLRTLQANGGAGSFLGLGSSKTLITPSIPCPPGSRFLITLDDRPNGPALSITSVPILFEGAYIYAIEGNGTPNARTAAVEMADMPRYFQTPNMNIMAPEVALSLHSSATPKGYLDEFFQYKAPTLSFPISTESQITQVFQLPQAYEHHILRFLFTETLTSTPGATVGVRIRESGGYVFTSDYLQTLLFNMGRFACDWPVKAGSQMNFDFTILDGTPGGTVTEQVTIEGIRRRRL